LSRVTRFPALQQFEACRDLLSRALKIEDISQLHRNHAASNRSSALTAQLLALCARASAACGDFDGATALIKRAYAMKTDDFRTDVMFLFHATIGEAHVIMSLPSNVRAASPAAMSAAQAAVDSFKRAFSLVSSSVSKRVYTKAQVLMGEQSL
jgi:hypothetical protein